MPQKPGRNKGLGSIGFRKELGVLARIFTVSEVTYSSMISSKLNVGGGLDGSLNGLTIRAPNGANNGAKNH